jgi:archaellum component FlaC
MGSNGKQPVFEQRQSFRIKENVPVRWQIKDSRLSGEGRVLDISSSGMLFEAHTPFPPIDRCVFLVENMQKRQPQFVPAMGRLVWSKRKRFQGNKFLCGVEFIEPAAEVMETLKKRVHSRISRIARGHTFRSVVSVILVAVMTAMSVYIIQTHLDQNQILQSSHQQMISAYDGQVALTKMLNKELEESRLLLAQTNDLVAKLQADNDRLKTVMANAQSELGDMSNAQAELDTSIAQLNTNIAKLKEENEKLAVDLATLNEQMNFLKGNVDNIKDAKTWIAQNKIRIKTVKNKIRAFKREAALAQKAAQLEKDRLGLLYGNNGFFVRDGAPVVPASDYQNPKKNIKVDVQFVK